MQLYSAPSFVTDIDLISTRFICLRPCTVLKTTGDSGDLLLNIRLVLKWFSLLFSHFWIRLILRSAQNLMILDCIFRAASSLYAWWKNETILSISPFWGTIFELSSSVLKKKKINKSREQNHSYLSLESNFFFLIVGHNMPTFYVSSDRRQFIIFSYTSWSIAE